MPSSLNQSQPTSRKNRRRQNIRRSQAADLPALRSWLEREEALGVQGNFFCNWSIIERAHRARELLVYIDRPSGQPIAFQLGRLLSPGILQVRSEYRRTGVGREMVEYCIQLALRNDQCLLYIECEPATSIPFWQRLGFTHLSGDKDKNYAYRVLEKPLQLPLPGAGAKARVCISFYPEERNWNATLPPYTSSTLDAMRLSDGTVHLDKRVLFHERAHGQCRDVVVEIEVDGQLLHLGKAKHQQALRFGLKRCKNGWYVDVLFVAERVDA